MSLLRSRDQRRQALHHQLTLAEQQEMLRSNMVARFAKADTRIGNSKSTLSFLQSQIDAWNKSSD